jgi:hypothetical protein
MTPRTDRCRYCGESFTQHTGRGRPKQFCSDRCRRAYAEVRRDLYSTRPPLGEPIFHSREAEQRLRALHAEMRSLCRSLYAFSNESERRGDIIEVVRCEAAGAAIEQVLVKQFADLEGRPAPSDEHTDET